MDSQQLQLLRRYEENYWWHVTRRAILQSVLNRFLPIFRHPRAGSEALRHRGSRKENKQNYSFFCLDSRLRGNDRNGYGNDIKLKILDVGCGTGENFKWLSEFGEVVGADTSELAVELASEKGTAVLGRAEDLPFEEREFDLVIAFDVLEHLKDEQRALGEWGRVLRSQGLLFLSVPAYQWLFGPHDRALAHLRRYTLSQLKKLLQQNNFQIIFSSYVFCLTFPVFLIQRWLARSSRQNRQQYVPVSPWLNNFLIGLGKLETNWLRFGQFPWGSSLVVLAKKND